MLTITVLYCHNAVAVPSAVKLMKYRTKAAASKSAKFDLVKSMHNKKIDLLKQIHQEWAHYDNQMIMAWNNIKSCTEESKEQLFDAALAKAKALDKSHMELWKALAEENYNSMKNLAEKQKNSVSNF
jgi:hypothetical protein